IDLLLLDYELLIQIGVPSKAKLRNCVEGDRIGRVVGVSRRAKSNRNPRQSLSGPIDVCRSRTLLRGLGGNRWLIVSPLPFAPALVNQLTNALRVHIARDDDRSVFGPVVPVEKLAAVAVFIR